MSFDDVPSEIPRRPGGGRIAVLSERFFEYVEQRSGKEGDDKWVDLFPEQGLEEVLSQSRLRIDECLERLGSLVEDAHGT